MNPSKHSTRLLLMLSLCLAFASCKKDEEEVQAPALTKKQKLTGNEWMRTAYSVEPAIDFDQNGTQENNLMPYLAACDLDDFTDLNSDNTYALEEGASKCDPNNPQVYQTGTWVFNSDKTIVIFSPNGGADYEYKIVSISSSELMTEEVAVINGVTYTFSSTFD